MKYEHVPIKGNANDDPPSTTPGTPDRIPLSNRILPRKDGGPDYHPAKLNCLSCNRKFNSWDRVKNRICTPCKRRKEENQKRSEAI